MTKQTQDLLNRLPMFVGFDDMFKNMENMLRVDSSKLLNWPPYNVVKTGDTSYSIEIALAGFTKSDIQVELDGSTLRVSGKTEPDNSVEYITKGIAERAFNRQFNLADNIEVKGAEMVNGILKIMLDAHVKLGQVQKISVS